MKFSLLLIEDILLKFVDNSEVSFKACHFVFNTQTVTAAVPKELLLRGKTVIIIDLKMHLYFINIH